VGVVVAVDDTLLAFTFCINVERLETNVFNSVFDTPVVVSVVVVEEDEEVVVPVTTVGVVIPVLVSIPPVVAGLNRTTFLIINSLVLFGSHAKVATIVF
jgi:hypothetical protein